VREGHHHAAAVITDGGAAAGLRRTRNRPQAARDPGDPQTGGVSTT
jgi:hypothetical protein